MGGRSRGRGLTRPCTVLTACLAAVYYTSWTRNSTVHLFTAYHAASLSKTFCRDHLAGCGTAASSGAFGEICSTVC